MTTGEEILLDNKGVDTASEAIADWAESVGMERRTALRIRLTAEELLLRLSSHYDGKQTVTLQSGKRFGVPCVNSRGELADNYAFGGACRQAELLEKEGVEIINGKVDLKKYQVIFTKKG